MKDVPRYVTSIQIQKNEHEHRNISIGFERNGAMRLCFQDTAELGQNSTYMNEASFRDRYISCWCNYGNCMKSNIDSEFIPIEIIIF